VPPPKLVRRTQVSVAPTATGGRAPTAARRPAAQASGSVSRLWVLDVPFSARSTVTAAGAKWLPDSGVFAIAATTLPAGLQCFVPQTYSYEQHVQRRLDEAGGHKQLATAQSSASESLQARDHQRVAIDAIVRAAANGAPGFLLADDVGLGKTISAWRAILELPDATTVLVVAPLSVLAHWRRTIGLVGDAGKDIILINYDRLNKLFEVTPAARKRVKSKKGLARAGTAPEFDVIVWDESHRCKNPTSARAKFAAKLTSEAEFCIWLSATAGQNPLELSYLAPLLAHATGCTAKDLKDFEAWCQQQGLGLSRGKFGKWEWAGSHEDLTRTHQLLFGARKNAPLLALRRRPEDIAGWPTLQRILLPVGLEAEAAELYATAWTEFRAAMAMIPSGKNPKGALVAQLRLRQKGSLIRVSGTVEFVRELLENNLQVAISAAFTETVDALREQLGGIECAVVDGRAGAAEREAARLRFQRGEVRVVIFTVEEGISLHQGEYNDVPRAQVIHDLRWSAIQMAQLEGRCHRDGKFAQVYWAYAEDTVEARIANIVVRRLTAMKSMIGDDTETLSEIQQLLEGIGEVG
jgi:superfamily II DNA or RNA helicase